MGRDVASGRGERDEPRDRAQVRLAVAAREHLGRERLVERRARREQRDLRVVDPVHEGDEAERVGLALQLGHVAERDGVDALDDLHVLRGVQPREVRDQLGEGVDGHGPAAGLRGIGPCVEVGGVDGDRVAFEGAAPVVEAVDADGVEPVAHGLDLAEEVGRREAPLPQGVRRRVARRGDARAVGHEVGQQARHHHRVARVVELELVDGHERRSAEDADGALVAESPDERRVLDEGAEVLRSRHGVPERREEVRLADAEPAVEVDAGLQGGRLLAREQAAAGSGPVARERAQHLDGLRLGVVLGVGPVGVEPRVVELAWRHEVRGDLLAGDARRAADERTRCRALRVVARRSDLGVRHRWVSGCHVAVQGSPARAEPLPLTVVDARRLVPAEHPPD